ncbi:MAG: glycoside hydrolase family 2, partial [Lachnospiraceae bacterium]|nr:glycoside hydrolase family 2 [Lachnospiraceae bacterium]
MKKGFVRLYTEEGENLSGIPHDEYPRPQLKRVGRNSEYIILNGKWGFKSRNNDCEILVPFCPESLLSGVKGKVLYGETLFYTRCFELGEIPANSRIILHFGAVSRDARVFVNGTMVCQSDNAYLPFSADITEYAVKGENSLRVEAVNDLKPEYPHGKQRKKRGGMWYTPVSGIWQTVWLENVPERYICGIDIDADDTAAEITVALNDPGCRRKS